MPWTTDSQQAFPYLSIRFTFFLSPYRVFYFSFLPPEFFKPCRIGGGIADGVLDVAMPQIVLNEPCIRALVC